MIYPGFWGPRKVIGVAAKLHFTLWGIVESLILAQDERWRRA
jgi:hypothetical protein